MVMKLNEKLMGWFRDNQIGPDKAVTLQEIPSGLEADNLKGELADLQEAKIVSMAPNGRFYFCAGEKAEDKPERPITAYARHESLFGDIFNEISKRSKYKPIVSKELERQFGISGPDVRDEIRNLRRKGEPIVGSNTGYYLATGTEDIKQLISDMESRISSMRETINSIKKRAYDRFGTQLTLEL